MTHEIVVRLTDGELRSAKESANRRVLRPEPLRAGDTIIDDDEEGYTTILYVDAHGAYAELGVDGCMIRKPYERDAYPKGLCVRRGHHEFVAPWPEEAQS
jgi:hypothetical protein